MFTSFWQISAKILNPASVRRAHIIWYGLGVLFFPLFKFRGGAPRLDAALEVVDLMKKGGAGEALSDTGGKGLPMGCNNAGKLLKAF